jgi:hypothetical protein
MYGALAPCLMWRRPQVNLSSCFVRSRINQNLIIFVSDYDEVIHYSSSYLMPVVRYRQQHTINCRGNPPVIRSMSLSIGPSVHVSVLWNHAVTPRTSNLWIVGQIFMKCSVKKHTISIYTTLYCIQLPTIFNAYSEDMKILLILFLCSVK